MLFLKCPNVRINLLKSNQCFRPLHITEILIVLILLFMNPPSDFHLDTLSEEEERSILCCGVNVLPWSGHPSESNLIALSATCSSWEGCQKGGSISVEITLQFEQDDKFVMFLSLSVIIFKVLTHPFLLPKLLTWSKVCSSMYSLFCLFICH